MASPLGKIGRSLTGLGEKLAGKVPGRRSSVTDVYDGGGGGSTAAYGALAAAPTATVSEDEGEAALLELASGYFDPPEHFDALEFELRQLPIAFEASQLEAVAEERTGVLEVVSEKLSQHVLANYDRFVAGVEEVGQVERSLVETHATTKHARERLALALREVSTNLKISKDTRRKQGLTGLLEVLLKLQQAHNLQRALKEAQEGGEYAEALWLCARCTQSMEELGDGLRVAQELRGSTHGLYADTVSRLEGALAAVCADFRPSHYTKVLEGYMFLGNVGQLGDEVQSAFIATIATSSAKVVRGVLLTRPGAEDKAAVAGNLQELVRFLPSDLFRTCLARVLMVLFDILVSHFHMVRWHEAALERHATESAALTAARRTLQACLRGTSAGGAPAGTAAADDPFGAGGGGGIMAVHPGAASAPSHFNVDDLPPLVSTDSDPVSVTGRAVLGLQRGTASELEEIEARASDEAEWGAVLQAVHAGLLAGRKLIWEEAARRIGVLLSSPAAFEGEHFLQVMDWTQRALAVGESFSGAPCASLRGLLERQAAKFFRLFHHSNIEALSSMLDKEVWKRLPAQLPSLAEALAARSSSSDEVGGTEGGGAHDAPHVGGLNPAAAAAAAAANGGFQPFEHWVVSGNPWRRQTSPRTARRRAAVAATLGFGGTGNGLEDGPAAAALEVDEYGVPRTASTTPSAGLLGPGEAADGASGLTSEDTELDDVFGDYIDEDTQQVHSVAGGSGMDGWRGTAGDAPPAVTNASWRMYKWMRDYAALMRPLRTVAPAIFAGLCELYELYLLHVFATFGDVSLWDLPHVAGSGGTQQGGSAADGGAGGGAADPALTPRLRATLLRVAGESIGKYRALFVAQPGSKLARALEPRAAAGGHAGGAALPSVLSAAPSQPSAAAAYFRRTLPGGGPGGSPATGPGMGPAGAPGGGGGATAAAAGGVQHSGPSASELSVSVNPGNLFGLLERCTAAESLLAVGAELARARGGLAHALPQGEGGSVALEGFLGRTLGAAEDLRDFVVRAGVRLLLPLRWVPERLGGTSWTLGEPPTGQGPWVDDLSRQLDLVHQRVAQVPGLDSASGARLWGAAAAHVAEACLEGFSRCKRCSLEGRAAMSLDLQGVQRALAKVLPRGMEPTALRHVDAYIKAFYIPLTELPHWAQTHPEYSTQQLLSLTSCIAESSGLKKKDRAALVEAVEADLRAVSGGGSRGTTSSSSSSGWGGGGWRGGS